MHRLAMTHLLLRRGQDHLVRREGLKVASRYRRNDVADRGYRLPQCLIELSVMSVDGSRVSLEA